MNIKVRLLLFWGNRGNTKKGFGNADLFVGKSPTCIPKHAIDQD
jgi:hypothetical protein